MRRRVHGHRAAFHTGFILVVLHLFHWLASAFFVPFVPDAVVGSVGVRVKTVTDLHLFLQADFYSSRGFHLYDYYQSITFPPQIDFHYCFVGLLPRNTTKPPNIAMPDRYLDWESYPLQDGQNYPIHETAKRFFVWNYVLEHTDARWIFCGFDDIYINFDLLLPYMLALERRWNPLEDIVIRGDCIVNGPIYLQGGAGSVFSRAAVRQLAPLGNYTVWGIWQEHDDQRLGRTIDQANIDIVYTSSSAFWSCDWGDEKFRGLETGNYSDLDVQNPCPKISELDRNGCRKYLAPINQVVFFHTKYTNFDQRMQMTKNVWNAPPWLFFYHYEGWLSQPCRYTGEKFYSGIFPMP
jgi:hypothetical protein